MTQFVCFKRSFCIKAAHLADVQHLAYLVKEQDFYQQLFTQVISTSCLLSTHSAGLLWVEWSSDLTFCSVFRFMCVYSAYNLTGNWYSRSSHNEKDQIHRGRGGTSPRRRWSYETMNVSVVVWWEPGLKEKVHNVKMLLSNCNCHCNSVCVRLC